MTTIKFNIPVIFGDVEIRMDWVGHITDTLHYISRIEVVKFEQLSIEGVNEVETSRKLRFRCIATSDDHLPACFLVQQHIVSCCVVIF